MNARQDAALKLSIIIPVLNEGGSLETNLQALQALRADCELILVDGGSHDGSVAKAQAYVDQVIVAGPGRALQMNAGAALARGSYLLFLHADTHLPKDLMIRVRAWHQNSVSWGFFPVRLSGSHWLLRCVETGINWRSKLSSVSTGDQCLFVKRALFNTLKGFPALPLMEDVAFSKILRRQAKPLFENKPVISSSRRWEKHGMVTTIVLMWRLRLAYFLGADPAKLAQRYYPKRALASQLHHE